MKLLIEQGRVIDPHQGLDDVVDLFIEKERIVALGVAPEGFTPDRRIDARGRWVLPGLVDLAARLREPGFENKATIASETRAAASAGITTLICPPDTDPPVDSPAQIELIHRRAKQACGVRVHPLGALTEGLQGVQLAEMAALKRAGALGASQGLKPLDSHVLLRRALEYAASHEITVFLHPIDRSLAAGGCAHEGSVATRLGLTGIPEAAETASLGVILALVAQTGARIHLCRLSTARGAALVARARQDGLPVSADVCAHQLFLTEMDVADFNSVCHVVPPLRTARDREGLRQALADGTISAICSDHQPHEADAKLAPFPATQAGMSTLETLLPLTLRLAEEGVLPLMEAIRRVTTTPASIMGLPTGTLAPDARADITLVDPARVYSPSADNWLSAGRNSPFFGWEFQGRVTHTLAAGRVIFESRT
ncbi:MULTISPECIES: dihydroorotase [unclassified Ectothiorhodospira]|uniref:dihydroorotase n=1 Tax=unclassified Ectothiorhodospira TaxID=2684909 RepID=UPI001EE85EFD|nr:MULTISPECIES: dihydroorotase [unclassified Ectothiorhodospira]MCG5514737.1 dihydroorotase [Ectothiorhodospira sp. 9100]MCG5518336.1 dihydroorotase [Ectothiorhodospira sp. 9905]